MNETLNATAGLLTVDPRTYQSAEFGTVISSVPTPRERIATAALQGLLAATPTATQSAVSADAYASRAVRYADALLEALNRATPEVSHARKR